MARIALLEDEPVYREEVARFLEMCGHDVIVAGSLAAFYPLMSSLEIAIIDVLLPDGEGYEAVYRLRETDPGVGIIMLTGLSATEYKLRGFSDGADHYLIKPVQLLELQGIISALLRRVAKSWCLDLVSRQLIDPEDHRETINHFEATLLQLLIDAKGGIVSRRTLVEQLGLKWSDYDLRRMDTQISRFRSRWLKQTNRELPLKTEHRSGYSFGASIRSA